MSVVVITNETSQNSKQCGPRHFDLLALSSIFLCGERNFLRGRVEGHQVRFRRQSRRSLSVVIGLFWIPESGL